MDRETRHDAQVRLKDALDRLNHALGAHLVGRARLTVGDEFELLVDDPADLIPALAWLSTRIAPVRVRLGIGRGAIYTTTDRDMVQEADGPAFHQARAALDHASAEDQWAAVRGLGDSDDTLSASLAAIGLIQSGWTKRMNEIVLELSPPDSIQATRTQKAVASRLAVSPATVSTALKAAHYPVMRKLERETDRLLVRSWNRWKEFEKHLDRLDRAASRLNADHPTNMEDEVQIVKSLHEVASKSPGLPESTQTFLEGLADMLTDSGGYADEALKRVGSMMHRLLTHGRRLLDAPVDKKLGLGDQRLRELERTYHATATRLQQATGSFGQRRLIDAVTNDRDAPDAFRVWLQAGPPLPYGRWLADTAEWLTEEVEHLGV